MAKTSGVNLLSRPARQESRARVLGVLREAGVPQSISAVAEATGLSAGAVRFHLANLLRAGSAREVRQPEHTRPGRPAVLYEALPADADDPAAAYRMLAALLARQLTRSRLPTAASEAGRRWAYANYAHSVDDPSRVAALDIVTRLFQESGFDPTMCDDGRTVALHRCPFYDLATEQPEVICGVHHGLTVGTLEKAGITTGVQVVPVLDGSGPCLVRLADVQHPPELSVPARSAEQITP